MSFQVTVQPSGRQFTCDADESILTAAIRAGVGLPYGCKNGACSSCKGKLVSGQVEHGPHQERALSAHEQQLGMALFCVAKPQSDVTIEAREVAGAGDIPVRKLPVRVAKLDKVADDVIVLSLQLPANDRLQYKAGQYVEFLLRDGKRRSYSMATAPHKDEHMSLHIRHLPGGLFTDQVFTTLKERDILRIEGPLGTFFLREDSDKPIILLASGTGFAPIKAIVEQLEHAGSKRPVTLYWGGRRPQDLYMDALCQQWEQTLPNFKYVPVVSNAQAEDNWSGRTGFVHRAVMEDFPDLSGHQVYACGAPIVVESAQRDFSAQCGLPQDEFYADSFTSEADLAKPVADSPAA
ncbi:CDP-6-deoxy-delta-3,4-glucoseen reductase [Herbaspirillum seropedicae]|uniref:ATPase with chaperone activity, ATP-binding subunit protein n=2 Tax=Herbaspirillum seropedicae TaxID=964 RepID=D8J224_HERSS|nr:CDP-6-deoxy-delta-3,4-glucoseen reductase [Herbaspirillum seropedicae]ADJ64807.1 ATPase with chaperone activity, ATP-binding subunit protein [Herbaspirillum seropedicae SmR1]AKN66714.1 CDP-6-deoxy-delta-3,4-glucoseen reductase [Herbaspirillum seropedicae]NQE28288.1 CDP-6-deoxy-delta-3,4-glucoseen reductase [Herbaspirillum seropedicae]UMU22703.1 CDP-6-deoxy-delta-3,4-glucoseen reductase [Herbaspirillum seropedicae]CAM32597.1 CDP-6-deoxy-delta-3,4-glucoseen reductase [Herbaspirillum seropedic